jgi:cell division protein FtsB
MVTDIEAIDQQIEAATKKLAQLDKKRATILEEIKVLRRPRDRINKASSDSSSFY